LTRYAADVDVEALVDMVVPPLAGKRVAVVPLGGGITNRNYRVDAGGESYVLRIPGELCDLLGIDRHIEYECSLAAARLGVGPEVVAFVPEDGRPGDCESPLLVTRFVPGRALTPKEVRRPNIVERVVRALRCYHDGSPGAGSFSPFETVRSYHALARERGVDFPPEMDTALGLLAGIEEAVHTEDPPCPCHNDLLPANFIDDGRSVWILDWEYAGMGDRFFDLGNLAVNNGFDERHERMVLNLYFGEVREEDLRRLRMMRLASDMRESSWGFLQSSISTLDFDFTAYGREHLTRFLETAEQVKKEHFL
jgi:thiamine kinase-like enzyme